MNTIARRAPTQSMPLTPLISKFKEVVLNYNRRGKNKAYHLGPVLPFIGTQYIKYDTLVFILSDDQAIASLKEKGFVAENRCRYKNSEFTLFWAEFKLEFEVVKPEEWDDLRRCVNLSNTTSYFNLDKIYDALHLKD